MLCGPRFTVQMVVLERERWESSSTIVKESELIMVTRLPTVSVLRPHWYTQQSMDNSRELSDDGLKESKTLFYLMDNLKLKGNTDEKNAERLMMYLPDEAFDLYLNHFNLIEKPRYRITRRLRSQF